MVKKDYKTLIYLTLLILALTNVSASINITGIEKSYSDEMDVKPILSIIPEESIQALLSSKIVCEGFDLEYNIQPLKLEKGNEITVEIPYLPESDKINGQCVIYFYLTDLEDKTLEKKWTDSFNIDKESKEETGSDEQTVEEQKQVELDNNTIKVVEILKEPHEDNSWFYFILFVLALLILAAFFLIKNKWFNRKSFDINRGWKINKHKRW
jgi:ATP-dependent Zn protease